MEWWDFLTPVTNFIPVTYQQLGIQWGLSPELGALVAFLAGALLLFGLFYLGIILSFGKLTGDTSARKALILISAAMALLGAYYGAGILIIILSNIIYIVGTFIAVIVLGSIARAMLGGWHAAGVTKEKARQQLLKVKQNNLTDLVILVQSLRQQGFKDEDIIRLLISSGIIKGKNGEKLIRTILGNKK